MSQPSFHQGDHHFLGAVTFGGTFNPPPNSITDAAIPAGAGISGLKLQQQRLFSGGRNGTVVDEKSMIGSARGAGQLLSFRVQLEEDKIVGDSTITVDLKKNGVTVLTTPISFSSVDNAGTWKSGTLTGSLTFVAGDRFRWEVDATANTGTLGKGLAYELSTLDAPQ